MYIRILLLGLCVCCVQRSVGQMLPERARHGLIWQHMQNYALTHELQQHHQAYSWDAWIDNSDPAMGKFRQHYFINDDYFVGSEGTLTGPPDGFVKELAKEHGALLVSLEHRFYGNSVPNRSITTENYRYHTVEQALADIAAFSQFLSQKLGKPGLLFFTFGGSYPGALSAWYRIAYPNMTLGSLASSGVVNAILSFPQFDQVVAQAIGLQCSERLRATTQAFERALESPREALEAKALFGVDEDMWNPDFFYMLADSAAMADQYGFKAELCGALLEKLEDQPSDTQLRHAFANFTKDHYGPYFGQSCFYDTRCLANPHKATVNERSWRWQKCSQLAYFQVAPDTDPLRSSQIDLEYHVEQCRLIFGLDRAAIAPVRDINDEYGGARPEGSRIFYSDFGDDPWQAASIEHELGAEQPYALASCDGCGHCMDLHKSLDSDPEPIKQLRQRFREYLHSWLAEGITSATEAQSFIKDA